MSYEPEPTPFDDVETIHVSERDHLDPLHDELVGGNQLLEQILAELRHSNARAREGAISHVEIHDLAPTKDRPNPEPQVTVTRYTGSEPEVEEAVRDWAHAHELLTSSTGALELDKWRATVEALKS